MLTNCYEAASLAHVYRNEIADINVELVHKESALKPNRPFSHLQATTAAHDSVVNELVEAETYIMNVQQVIDEVPIAHLDASNTGGFSAFDEVHLTHIQLNDTYQQQETSNLASEINMIKLNEDK